MSDDAFSHLERAVDELDSFWKMIQAGERPEVLDPVTGAWRDLTDPEARVLVAMYSGMVRQLRQVCEAYRKRDFPMLGEPENEVDRPGPSSDQ